MEQLCTLQSGLQSKCYSSSSLDQARQRRLNLSASRKTICTHNVPSLRTTLDMNWQHLSQRQGSVFIQYIDLYVQTPRNLLSDEWQHPETQWTKPQRSTDPPQICGNAPFSPSIWEVPPTLNNEEANAALYEKPADVRRKRCILSYLNKATVKLQDNNITTRRLTQTRRTRYCWLLSFKKAAKG